MPSAPNVSVLMTAYNREAYIAEAIESVLAQTFTDFELIVVDDGSGDRTVEVARGYLDDPRVRVYINERNLGDYPNRNHAARLARGRFLKYHDSDDVMYPHCLETMVRPLANESRAAFALSGPRWWPGGPCPMLLTPRMCYQREFLGSGMFQLGPSCALFRAETFHTLGQFPEKGPHSDLMFWLHACARVQVLLVPGDLFWYRLHAGQHLLSAEAGFDRAAVDREVWRALARPKCPLTPEEREQARRNWAFIIARTCGRDLLARRWRLAGFRLRQSGLSATDWLRYLRSPRRDPMAGTPAHEPAHVARPAATIASR